MRASRWIETLSVRTLGGACSKNASGSYHRHSIGRWEKPTRSTSVPSMFKICLAILRLAPRCTGSVSVFVTAHPRIHRLLACLSNRMSPSPDSRPSAGSLHTRSSEDAPSPAPTRAELVGLLEELADRVRHENINVRLVLTALAAAVHAGDERELARHVARFETRCEMAAAQERLLRDALRILDDASGKS